MVTLNGTTGLVTVSSNGTPAAMQLASGDGQSGVVNNNLSSELRVRVLDSFSQPVAGTPVTFTVTQGGGSIVTAMPVSTDSNGYAGATVKLGTLAGTGAHQFRAASVASGSLTVDFSANGLAGAAASLAFTQQPASAFATSPFGVQPRVTALDAFGNTANLAGSATLSILTGTGALSGVVTTPFSAGIASWSSVAYSIQEAGVVLRATAGALTADSAAFNVGALPPGACQRNDSYFTTADGGCKDLTTGLVWSARSPWVSYHALVWDTQVAGSTAADADDAGRNADYHHSEGCPGTCDSDLLAYCHSLNEGGRTDWRPATMTQFVALYNNMLQGVPPYLNAQGNQFLQTATTRTGSNTESMRVNLANGQNTWAWKNNGDPTYCVRGEPLGTASELVTSLVPPPFEKNTTGHVAIVRIRDTLGKYVMKSGVTVTLASSTLGTLGGTTSVTTNQNGEAVFDAWSLSASGNATVTVTSAGLSSTTFQVKVGDFPHICVIEDSRFQTADGGCKDLVTGKVWSLRGPFSISWHEAAWGSTAAPLFNVQPDGDDGGRTNDYDGGTAGTVPDNGTTNYCHDLVEGGYSDWRLPTSTELWQVDALGAGAATHFAYNTNFWAWSSTTTNGADYAAIRNLATGAASGNAKWWTGTDHSVICVRP